MIDSNLQKAPMAYQTTLNETTTDQNLVVAIKAGSEIALELVMRRYNQRLFRIARSILNDDDEAIDVVQDAYISAYYKLEQLQETMQLANWLSSIVRNEAMMRLRKSKRISYNLDAPNTDYDNRPSKELQPIDAIANQQLRHVLEAAVDQLPTSHRTVYVMRAIQQLSTRETAESLDISVDLVKTRYLRAKRGLQKTLLKHIENTNLQLYEFMGERCDLVVNTVIQHCFHSQN